MSLPKSDFLGVSEQWMLCRLFSNFVGLCDLIDILPRYHLRCATYLRRILFYSGKQHRSATARSSGIPATGVRGNWCWNRRFQAIALFTTIMSPGLTSKLCRASICILEFKSFFCYQSITLLTYASDLSYERVKHSHRDHITPYFTILFIFFFFFIAINVSHEVHFVDHRTGS